MNKHIEGSKGMCLDSSEGFARTHMCKYVPDLPGCINETIGGGACYQNSVRDITVSDIDVGVYLGPEVNGNSVSNVMMIGMGQASYFIDGPNSENTVAGGFTAGFGGNLTVIKARSSAYNYFMSVQSEPGQNSTYFDFDGAFIAHAALWLQLNSCSVFCGRPWAHCCPACCLRARRVVWQSTRCGTP